MPTQLQLRRGTTNQHNSFTGVVGEVTINTTKKTAVVHDGSTAGGLELLRADMSNVFASATPTITSLNTSGNVDVGGNLTVTGTTTFNGGTITMGDADTDNVVFGADVNSNILPNTDNTYSLGNSSKKWSDVRTVLLTTTGAASLGSTLGVSGNFAVDTNKFTVNATSGDTVIAGDLAVNGGDLTTSQTTFNLLNTTATTLNVGGAATTVSIGANSGTTTVNNNLTITGDLTVNGTTTTVNSTTLTVDDKNIELASTASPSDVSADGAGITIKGTTDKTFNWVDATDAFTSSENLEIAAGKTVALSGSTSGKTTLNVLATASGTLTLPSATDTLVGKATTDTLTNKSISLTTNTLTGTSAELATAISDETGTGSLVFSTSPSLTTPNIGVATATTVNKLTITQPAAGSTLTIADGKTLTANNTLTFTGTDSSSVAFSAGGTVAYTSNKLSDLSSTTSSELAGVISDETGTGALVFATSPSLTTPSFSSIVNTGTLTLPTSTDTLVGRATTDTLTNKTLTSPVISSISNTGTLTLPTSTDTLVGRATTDTLTNKSVSLTTNTITGTLAEFNTALSDADFATIAGTETLTNKTLTAPKIANGGFIADANGAEQIILNTTASAVNELTITNAATTNRPSIAATGDDTNIGISITPKGTGTIVVGNSIIPAGNATMDLGSASNKFRDLYLHNSSFFMGTTKVTMHADGYLVFNTNSGGNYPAGSNVSVATATNGVAPTTSTAAALAIALGG